MEVTNCGRLCRDLRTWNWHARAMSSSFVDTWVAELATTLSDDSEARLICYNYLELWRRGSESNRRTRLCRPLHDHSATPPRA